MSVSDKKGESPALNPVTPASKNTSNEEILEPKEIEELQSLQRKLKNVRKTADMKEGSLSGLDSNLRNNRIVSRDGGGTVATTPAAADAAATTTTTTTTTPNNRSKDFSINDIVRPIQPQVSSSSSTTTGSSLSVMPVRVASLYTNANPALSSVQGNIPPHTHMTNPITIPTEITGTAATAILESIFRSGIPVMSGIGSPMDDFCRQWDQKSKEFMQKVARGEIRADGSLPNDPNDPKNQSEIDPMQLVTSGAAAAPDGNPINSVPPDAVPATASKNQQLVATGVQKRVGKRKAGASAAGKRGATSNIPTKFAKRYPTGTLPLYQQQQQQNQQKKDDGTSLSTTTTTSSPHHPNGHALDHGTRYLEFKIPSYKTPEMMFKYYLMTYVKEADKQLLENLAGGDLRTKQPTQIRWEDVQYYAFVEAKTEEESCMLGTSCFARSLLHPGGSFTFRKWRDASRRKGKRTKKDPHLCYADILLYINLIKDNARSTGLSSAGYECPFIYLIGIPGEYNSTAFRKSIEGNNEGTTRPIRHLVTTNLKATYYKDPHTGEVFRKFVEKKTLQCLDGSRKVSQMQLVDPQSYTTFGIEPMTNERILLMFIFRVITDRYKDILDQDLNQAFKVCRLAFVPFEDGLKLFNNEEFRRLYLPSDFMLNSDYIIQFFDMMKIVVDPSICSRPILEGHSIYWLLHIRLNAALNLLNNGLDQFKEALSAPTSAAKNTRQQSQQQQQAAAAAAVKPQTFTLPKSASLPATNGAEPRVWVVSANLSDALSAELDGIREKLHAFVKSHSNMLTYFKNAMENGKPIHDDALLPSSPPDDEDLWLSIKPSSSCIGPYFPEDKKYIEYYQKPKVENNPGPGQLAHFYITRWCQGLSEPHPSLTNLDQDSLMKRQQIIVGCLSTSENENMTWTTSEPPPMKSIPGETTNKGSPIYFSFPEKKKRDINLQLIFGDFRGFVWWLQNEADPDFLKSLYVTCGKFDKIGWKYTYHSRVEKALENGSWLRGEDGTSKTSYVILMALLVVIYCATNIMNSLQKLYETRFERFKGKLEILTEDRSQVLQRMIKDRPKDILSYEFPSDAKPPARERLYQFNDSMKALREAIYQTHKFINSHLSLAYAMVVHCTDDKGYGPTDSALMDTSLPMVQGLAGSTRPSLYEVYYPFGGNVMCEDNLVDCASLESFAKFISEVPNKEPLLEGQSKGMPVRCHTRDYEPKTRKIIIFNTAYSQFCSQNLYCSSLGGYRTSNVKPRFERCLEIYGRFHNVSSTDLKVNTEFLRKHKSITINTLRENNSFHIRNNPGFYQAVLMAFDYYTSFEIDWLQSCMDAFRYMLDRKIPITQIDKSLQDNYGKNTPYVYRRAKVDFYKFVWNRLKSVMCQRLVSAFMDMDKFEWPDVLSLSKESIQYLVYIVKELDIESETFDYADTLIALGCSEDGIAMIKTVEKTFSKDGQISSIDLMLSNLTEEEHLIIFAFFHLLRGRSSIKTLQLTAEDSANQREAISKRAGIKPGDPIPISTALMHFCSIAGCNKRKTNVIQERGIRYFGNSDVSWDLSSGIPVCRPKKPPKASANKGHAAPVSSSSSTPKPKKKKKTKKRKAKDLDQDLLSGKTGDAGEEDEEEEDDDEDDPALEDDDMIEKEKTKSLHITLREFNTKVKQIVEKQKKMVEKAKAAGRVEEKDESGVVHGTEADVKKLEKWSEKLEERRVEVFKAARTEANRFTRRLFDLPCESTVLESYSTVGQVVERMFIKDRVDFESYTSCPSCGCPTVFRTDMFYSNGFSCGICDMKLREDLTRPCCLGCNKIYLTKTVIKKKKRGHSNATTSSSVVATSASSAPMPALSTIGAASEKEFSAKLTEMKRLETDHINTILSIENKKSPGQMYNEQEKTKIEEERIALKELRKWISSFEQQHYLSLNSATNNGIIATSSIVSTAVNPPVSAAADKRGSKRKKIDIPIQTVAKASSSAEEDRAIKHKRTNRSLKKLGIDEWYSYTLTDKDLFERRELFVCGICNYDRYWLRELEPWCTVQEFTFLLRSNIVTGEEAKRCLALAHWANTPVKRNPQQQSYLNKVLVGRKKKKNNKDSNNNSNAQSRLAEKMKENTSKMRRSKPRRDKVVHV